MRMKDEPEVEEEEEEEDEEEEKEKEEREKKKMEAGSSSLQQETEPEEAAQEMRPPADFTCSKETNHGNVFSLLPVLCRGHLHSSCIGLKKQRQPLLMHFDFVTLCDNVIQLTVTYLPGLSLIASSYLFSLQNMGEYFQSVPELLKVESYGI